MTEASHNAAGLDTEYSAAGAHHLDGVAAAAACPASAAAGGLQRSRGYAGPSAARQVVSLPGGGQ